MILKDFKQKYNITETQWRKLIYKYPEIQDCLCYKKINKRNLKYINKLKTLINILGLKFISSGKDFIHLDELSSITKISRSTLYLYYCRPELTQFKKNANFVDVISLEYLKEFLLKKLQNNHNRQKFEKAIEALNELL
jgi:hypothetical protein